MEITSSSSTLRIYGDRLSRLSTSQVIFHLGCLQIDLGVPTRKLFIFQWHGRHRQSFSSVWKITKATTIRCSLQRFCSGLYRLFCAWFWDNRSFTSQQHTESGLGMFECTTFLFRMWWGKKQKHSTRQSRQLWISFKLVYLFLMRRHSFLVSLWIETSFNAVDFSPKFWVVRNAHQFGCPWFTLHIKCDDVFSLKLLTQKCFSSSMLQYKQGKNLQCVKDMAMFGGLYDQGRA